MRPRTRTLSRLSAALLAAPALAGALPPLEQLETRIDLAPAAQLAERSYESTRDALGAGRAGLGVSAFGNLGYSRNHEIIDPTRSWNYNQGLAGGGLSLPVLGSRLQLEDSLNEQQAQLAVLDARRQLERRELLGRLRKAYADYWQAQRLTLLAQEYLQDQAGFEKLAQLRTRAGLLLDADRLELLSGFSLARRDEASGNADRAVALGVMRALTGEDLDGGIAVRPVVPRACVEALDPGDGWADSDPEILGLQKVIAVRAASPRDSAFYPVQSSVQLGYQSLDDVPPGAHGSTALLSWTFQVPLGYRSERRLLERAAAAQLAHARLEYDLRRRELGEQRRELIARAAVLHESTQFAAARLAAADAAVEERGLRAARLDGDVAEQLQRARLARYNAAKALTEADKALVYWYADWARFETAGCGPAAPDAGPRAALPVEGLRAASLTDAGRAAAVAGGPVSVAALRSERTVYVWRSAGWLADAEASEFANLHAAGIARLLISLDAGQMRAARADPVPLVRAVRSTHEHGLRVELLLADPAWILPQQRAGLLAIIAALKSVPFDGLHLDLEPAQLDPAAAERGPLLGALAETLAAASAASPWPVALSLHPRDLDAPAGDATLADVLLRLHVSPTLMVYVANPERAVAIAQPLIAQHPQLSFSVALSLERTPGPETSLWSYPGAERSRRIAHIESALAGANFSGLTLQLEDAWGEAPHLAMLAAGE
ncbi:MAG TPA: TolC family protein [Steroidobacteraceae bacterium]|nr:TolC family protein [Steroidobacteraceae bacterium]